MGDKRGIIKILWTGGYDSSFRMAQLSKHDVIIQPYYLCDNRASERNELAAISSITEDIEKHPETKCTILPLIKVNVKEVEPDREITEAYLRLKEQTSIGSQYDWLPRFAKQVNGLELCLEKAETSKARNCILKFGKIKTITEGKVTYCIIDNKNSSSDLIKVFGAFHFPLPLFEMTKLDMREEYVKLGFGESIDKTWFCFTPIDNEPCGLCNPCISSIKEGMDFRFSTAGLRRYKHRIFYKNLYRIKRKFIRRNQ